MTNANPNRILQHNQAGDERANALKVFGGEMLTAFTQTTQFMDKHTVRTISSGKSAQFPVSGRTAARYHTPGNFIAGQKMNFNERVITIDDLLISDSFIANIDEALSHYETRSEIATQIGEALGQQFDRNVARVSITNALGTPNVPDLPGGTKVSASDAKTDGLVLRDSLFAVYEAMDEKYVPEMGRYVYLKPAQYYLLNRTPEVLDRDIAGEGSIAQAKLGYVAGFPVVKTNNLPMVDETADAGVLEKYRGDFSNVAALAQHMSAVGTVKLLDMAVESEYQIERQGTLVVGKYALGHGGLRPEAGGLVTTS